MTLTRRRLVSLIAGLSGLAAAAPASAGTVALTAGQPLDFGTFVVFGTASRQIAPDGTVTSSGLAPVAGARQGPADFTLRYVPNGTARSAVILISITTTSPQAQSGSVGTLANLTTDLPGIPLLKLGETRMITLPRCLASACDTRFRVGGRLEITGGAASASFRFPLQVTVRLLAEVA